MPSPRRGVASVKRSTHTAARAVISRTMRHAGTPARRALRTLPPTQQTRVKIFVKRLAGGAPVAPLPDAALVALATEQRSPVPAGTQRLYIGPANFAGQGYLWARAVEAAFPQAGAVSMAVHLPGGFDYPIDHTVNQDVYNRSAQWQEDEFTYVRRNFTDVLIEAQRPITGNRYVGGAFTEARILRGSGLRVAMMGHGRDVRLPERHRKLYPYSPYIASEWDEVPGLQLQASRNLDALASHDLPTLVSTPDLLDDLPTATWCPVVIDPSRWVSSVLPLERKVPVVVHAPTSANFKGSKQIDPAMQELHDRGVIEYRRIRGVPAAEMPKVIGDADIVLEQFRLGSYGVTACEAMAAGRVVVGHVADHVRERVRDTSGNDLPILEGTIENIQEVVLSLIAEPDRARASAEAGVAFVAEMHDGRRSAQAIAAAFEWSEAATSV